MLTCLILVSFCFASDSVIVPRQELEQLASKFIHESLETGNQKVLISFRSIPEKVVLPAGRYSVRISSEGHSFLRGNVSLPVEIVSQDQTVRRFVISLTLKTFGKVLITLKRFDRFSIIHPAEVREEIAETTTLGTETVANMDDLKGKRTKRIISDGSILLKSMLEPVPVIHQGMLVRLVVRSRGVTLSTGAIAKEDGGRGDLILVQDARSRKKLKARVVDSQTVELELK